jgi:hypothetical protein
MDVHHLKLFLLIVSKFHKFFVSSLLSFRKVLEKHIVWILRLDSILQGLKSIHSILAQSFLDFLDKILFEHLSRVLIFFKGLAASIPLRQKLLEILNDVLVHDYFG